ncbi:hypothetical protein B1J93_16225 [Leptospira kirschneri serovar Pomona]|uniref:Uncharacterized protein n=1 Tax=Leptospira kirschneri serovar Pomona TaxID=561005 RepID=A0A1T1DJA4_9LEPT|nr:hypothetical protein B1J93_16225 [Leptospira kirschneri serovar Pomona]
MLQLSIQSNTNRSRINFSKTLFSIRSRCITHNYIIKHLIFCMKSVFCNKINGIQFYKNQ